MYIFANNLYITINSLSRTGIQLGCNQDTVLHFCLIGDCYPFDISMGNTCLWKSMILVVWMMGYLKTFHRTREMEGSGQREQITKEIDRKFWPERDWVDGSCQV